MNENLMLIVPLAIFSLGLFAMLRLSRSRAMWVGATATLSMSIAVPSFATSAPVAIAAVLGALILLIVAFLRDRDALRGMKVPYLLVIFIVWSTVLGSVGSPMKMILLYAATGALLIALSFATIGAASRGQNLFLPLFALVIIVETAYAFAEEFLGARAMWPRANGTDVIENRVNPIVPLLAGRAMGTTAQPIPLGMLLGFCVLVCLWFALRRRAVSLAILSGVGMVGMVFAGTRSAFVALAGALGLWALMRFWRHPRILILVAAAGATVALSLILIISQAKTNFWSSDSFLHRFGVLETAGNLLKRNPLEVMFGSGYQSTGALIDDGVVQGVAGIEVFDQEFIRTLAALGVVGLILLLGTIVAGMRQGSELTILLIAFLTIGFVAFDGYSWRLFACLFVLVIAHGYGSAKSSPFNEDLDNRSLFAARPTFQESPA